ncbi:hypothetical protein [Cupriavidus sp. PET2-C1]
MHKGFWGSRKDPRDNRRHALRERWDACCPDASERCDDIGSAIAKTRIRNAARGADRARRLDSAHTLTRSARSDAPTQRFENRHRDTRSPTMLERCRSPSRACISHLHLAGVVDA